MIEKIQGSERDNYFSYADGWNACADVANNEIERIKAENKGLDEYSNSRDESIRVYREEIERLKYMTEKFNKQIDSDNEEIIDLHAEIEQLKKEIEGKGGYKDMIKMLRKSEHTLRTNLRRAIEIAVEQHKLLYTKTVGNKRALLSTPEYEEIQRMKEGKDVQG